MVGQHKNYVGLQTSGSLPSQKDNMQVKTLVVDSPFSIPFRGAISSSTNVSMNIYGLANWGKDWAKFLVLLHQQAKFGPIIVASLFPRVFFLVNNGDFPDCDQVQQLKCTIFFPHILPLALIEKS